MTTYYAVVSADHWQILEIESDKSEEALTVELKERYGKNGFEGVTEDQRLAVTWKKGAESYDRAEDDHARRFEEMAYGRD